MPTHYPIANPYQVLTDPRPITALPGAPPIPQRPAAPAVAPPAVDPTIAPFEQELARIRSRIPQDENQRMVVAKQLEATNGPAPQIPDFETAEQAALAERRAAGPAQAPQDDGASGWKKFLDVIADPTSSANFLFTAGTNLLQPRSEAESSLGFGLRGLGTAADRLSQARSARSAAQLEAQKTQADIAKTQQDITSAQAADTKIPSEIELNKARAYAAYQQGLKTKMPAAQVQLLDRLKDSILQLAPDVYDEASATLAAQSLIKPDMSRSDFVKDFTALYALFGGTADISAQANALADSVGLKGNLTLDDIQNQQRAAELRNNPEAMHDYLRSINPNATYEQVENRVFELTGRRSSRPRFEAAIEPGEAAQAAQAAATEEKTQSENERKLLIAQTMKNLDRMSREELREFLNRYMKDLSGPQKNALVKRLGVVE